MLPPLAAGVDKKYIMRRSSAEGILVEEMLKL
jgi:hypothetical protein